jgi:hypothetical protein
MISEYNTSEKPVKVLYFRFVADLILSYFFLPEPRRGSEKIDHYAGFHHRRAPGQIR